MKKLIIPFIFFVSIVFIVCKQSSRQENADKKKFSKSLDLYLPEGLEATLWAQSPMLYRNTGRY